MNCLFRAKDATLDEIADVWNDGMIRWHWCYWKCQVWGWTSVI